MKRVLSTIALLLMPVCASADFTPAHNKLDAFVDVSPQGQIVTFSKSPLTNNNAIDLFTITVGAGEAVGGTLHYSLLNTGGTSDIQLHRGELTFVCINKAGTISKDIDEVYLAASETKIASAGTHVDTWAMKTGDVCTLTLNMNSSLTSAVNTIFGILLIHNNNTVTLN